MEAIDRVFGLSLHSNTVNEWSRPLSPPCPTSAVCFQDSGQLLSLSSSHNYHTHLQHNTAVTLWHLFAELYSSSLFLGFYIGCTTFKILSLVKGSVTVLCIFHHCYIFISCLWNSLLPTNTPNVTPGCLRRADLPLSCYSWVLFRSVTVILWLFSSHCRAWAEFRDVDVWTCKALWDRW